MPRKSRVKSSQLSPHIVTADKSAHPPIAAAHPNEPAPHCTRSCLFNFRLNTSQHVSTLLRHQTILVKDLMNALTVGIISGFVYSCGMWAIAKMNGHNFDPLTTGVIKSILYTFVIAFPIGLAAHTVVAFFGWRTLLITPVALGMVSILAAGVHFLDGAKNGQLINILSFLGMPLAFSIPYSLILNGRVEQHSSSAEDKPPS